MLMTGDISDQNASFLKKIYTPFSSSDISHDSAKTGSGINVFGSRVTKASKISWTKDICTPILGTWGGLMLLRSLNVHIFKCESIICLIFPIFSDLPYPHSMAEYNVKFTNKFFIRKYAIHSVINSPINGLFQTSL